MILGCLSICERDKALVRDAQDISIHEYSWGLHMAIWYPLVSPSCRSYGQPSHPFFPLVRDISVSLGGIMSWRCRWFIKDPSSSFSEVDDLTKVIHPHCLLFISQFICRKHPHQELFLLLRFLSSNAHECELLILTLIGGIYHCCSVSFLQIDVESIRQISPYQVKIMETYLFGWPKNMVILLFVMLIIWHVLKAYW